MVSYSALAYGLRREIGLQNVYNNLELMLDDLFNMEISFHIDLSYGCFDWGWMVLYVWEIGDMPMNKWETLKKMLYLTFLLRHILHL